MTTSKERAEKARQALEALDQAWAYYTPQPRVVSYNETEEQKSVFPVYYAA